MASLPIAGIFFLLMTIVCLNFVFLWKPKEQVIRSAKPRKNVFDFFSVIGKNLSIAFLIFVMKFLKFLEKWLEKNRSRDINAILDKIDGMDGYEFERFLKPVFEKLGYSVIHTPLSGDQGADLILSGERGRIAVQVKRYSSKVSNRAVQEVVASKALYKCTEGLVVTNNYFTDSAIELAKANSIGLIDRDELKRIIIKSHN